MRLYRWWKRDDKTDAIASSLIFHVAFIGSMFLIYHNSTIVHEKLREVEREREREREREWWIYSPKIDSTLQNVY